MKSVRFGQNLVVHSLESVIQNCTNDIPGIKSVGLQAMYLLFEQVSFYTRYKLWREKLRYDVSRGKEYTRIILRINAL